MKTTVKSVIFNWVNEVYVIVDFLPILKKLLTSPYSSQNFSLSVTQAGYGFIYSIGSDFAFCGDTLKQIPNNCECALNASP